jgi:hypothetical protein
MGEKAQVGTRSLRRLPASGAAALGAVVGALLVTPVALAVAAGNDDDVAVVAPTTTSTALQTTTSAAVETTTTTAAVLLPEGPFAVVVTATSIETPEGIDASGTVGEVVPGTTFTCDGPACTLDFVRGGFRAVVALARDADGISTGFRWDYAPANCDGTGTDSGDGTIDLAPDGGGYRGTVEFATDVFAIVDESCAGARRGFDLVITPA